jgi:hypothetical protein
MSVKAGDCIHFTGIMDECCKAGINYRHHVGGPRNGWACRLPCRPSGHFTKPDQIVPCAQAEPISAEEVIRLKAESDTEVGEFLDRFHLARPLIEALRAEYRETGRALQQTVKCPACGGSLTLGISTVNGHTRGQCETKGCLSWIE